MRIDLSDLDRLTGFAEALERLFWCLMALCFITAVLGSAGTGLFVLILGAAAFVVRAGLEDFVRSRGEEKGAPEGAVLEAAVPEAAAEPKRTEKPKGAENRKPAEKPKSVVAPPEPTPEPEFTVYRAPRRLRRTKSAV